MTRILQIAKLLACVAICGYAIVASTFYVRLGAVLLQLQATMTQVNTSGTVAKVNAVLDNANRAVGNMDAALATINRPCKAGDCGTLAGISLATHEALVTTGQVEIVARHEKARIDVLDEQEAQIYMDTHGSLTQLREDLVSARATIAGLQPVEAQLSDEVVQLRAATVSLNAAVSDPRVGSAVGHADSALGHLDGITADTQAYWHKFLHPSWPHRVWHTVSGIGLQTAKFFW